ncbi:aldo/keto reductase [Candidatus Woesearchaeota archaeon]|jgi:diketogulonate reductase-like aldo/keto reductase|nr:aldo/keto reductase [Candidatus Woesearchaeota archaeon]MDP6647828.1 aldo/keto reductase [Candidatus Woesearchaeota archaeon]|tara:strand:+ start:2719 stop:3534 length:816 start_codon:yes stop_codon:yes gene_type:complete
MEYKQIGNAEIPVLGLGTWEIGGRFEADHSQKQNSIEIIKQAIELGITHIDTSEIYGNGFTEELIAEAISSFDRKKLFITSKVWSNHLNYDATIKALHSSLKRLKTDYLDLYVIHKPGKDMDLKGTMEALGHLNEQNLIRAIGVSNLTEQQISDAQKFLNNSRISAVQNEYNLLKRDEEIIELCNKNDILFIAYRPLKRGQLAKPGIPLLDRLAKKYNKTQSQIALNWLISKPKIVAIPKATKKEHLQDNLGSIGWKMEDQDYEALDKINQ